MEKLKPSLLDILIPTMPSRSSMLSRLLNVLSPQIEANPQARVVIDAGGEAIGPKRQRMVRESAAEYVVFVDDDDLVATDYVARILRCLKSKPDVVGIAMYLKMDGRPWPPDPIFLHSLRFRDNRSWSGNNRTPHHLCPMRREIALRASFGNNTYGEDYNFALGVLPHLKTEEWAGDAPIYLYEYVSPARRC